MTLSNLDKTELYTLTQFYYFEIDYSHAVSILDFRTFNTKVPSHDKPHYIQHFSYHRVLKYCGSGCIWRPCIYANKPINSDICLWSPVLWFLIMVTMWGNHSIRNWLQHVSTLCHTRHCYKRNHPVTLLADGLQYSITLKSVQ